MRRVQIYLEETVDDSLEAEARRRGVSKAALIRDAVNRDLPVVPVADDPWRAMAGWLEGEPAEDIDEVVYGRKG